MIITGTAKKNIYLLCHFAALYNIFTLQSTASDTQHMNIKNIESNLKTHVYELTETIGERNYLYYESLQRANEYIQSEFNKYGYKPSEQAYRIREEVYTNIIAEIRGKVKPQEIVIFGAHYDSAVGSPGANDNASGVAALLELARLCSAEDFNQTIRFIAFVNEEPPFFLSENMGSRVYAKEVKRRKDNIKAMICLETIGYYSDKKHSQSYPLFLNLFYPDTAHFIAMVGNLGSRKLVASIEQVFTQNSSLPMVATSLPAWVPGVNFSDHDSFWKYGYKACMVTDTAFYRYAYYHTIDDTYDKLNYEKIAQIVHGFFHVIRRLTF